MKYLLLIAAGLAVGLLIVGCQSTRAGYESAPYGVLKTDGKFELRDYPALLVIETPMAAGKDNGFMRLFRFIGGANSEQQKIAMTTPVFMSREPTRQTMAFVLPEKLKSDGAPKPTNPDVTLRELPPGRFAVLRFSGGQKAKNEAEALERLRTWMRSQELKTSTEPVFAYFDPPWTPSFWRRNEVMLRLD